MPIPPVLRPPSRRQIELWRRGLGIGNATAERSEIYDSACNVRDTYFLLRGVYVNFWPATVAAYIKPPFAIVNTAMPFS